MQLMFNYIRNYKYSMLCIINFRPLRIGKAQYRELTLVLLNKNYLGEKGLSSSNREDNHKDTDRISA